MNKQQKQKGLANKPQGNGSKNIDDSSAPAIKDDRFKAVHFDPRFAPVSKKNQKVKVDKRFGKMFNDPRFQVVNKVDKYGRELEVPDTNKELEDFYYVDDEDNEEESGQDIAIDGQDDEEEEIDAKAALKNNKKAGANKKQGNNLKGENKKQNKKANNQQTDNKQKIAHFNEQGKFEWNEESSSSDFDEDELQREMEEVEKIWEEEGSDEEDAPEGIPAKRVALVNYDWENIKAGDVMLFLNSFVPRDGFIKSVTVYPSDFGLKRMKEEQAEGPKGIWKAKHNPQNKEEKLLLEKSIMDANQPWIFRENETEDLDPIKLRRYEKDRMKYYYAVIEFDSIKTAKQVVDDCNGLEFELTNLKIDLRYVDKNLVFPHAPYEVCTELPAASKVHNFLNRAVHHTNVKLTWEEPNTNRTDPLFKNLKENDFGKIDINAYISSDSSGDGASSEDEEEAREMRRKALLGDGLDKGDWRNDFDKSKRRRNYDEDMVIKFNPGFDELGNKILEKADPEKAKNNKNDKKAKFKASKDDDWFGEVPDEDDEEDDDDLLIQKPKKEKKEPPQKVNKKEVSALELLVGEGDEKKGFLMNADDARFGAVYGKSDYAIDPTSKFYDAKSSGKLLQEQVKRRKKKVKTE